MYVFFEHTIIETVSFQITKSQHCFYDFCLRIIQRAIMELESGLNIYFWGRIFTYNFARYSWQIPLPELKYKYSNYLIFCYKNLVIWKGIFYHIAYGKINSKCSRELNIKKLFFIAFLDIKGKEIRKNKIDEITF